MLKFFDSIFHLNKIRNLFSKTQSTHNNISQSEENKVIIDGQTYYGGLNQPNLKFVKVNVDCWDRIFDLLSLREILAMSKTCQRMRQIGGHYFRENFHGTVCELRESTDIRISIAFIPLEHDDFLRFIDTIEINYKLGHLRSVSSMGLLCSLTTLCLHSINLKGHRLNGLKNIQTNIETIELNLCYIGDNSVGKFLASCPKLKCLRFERDYFESPKAKASLFHRTYPMLEHFQCTNCKECALELSSVLDRNPTIKRLRIGSDDLCKISLDTSLIKLDCLDIEVRSHEDRAVELVNRLKTLHTSGWFKVLHVSLLWADPFAVKTFVAGMAPLGALEVLRVDKFVANICRLTGLKELHLRLSPEDVHLQPIAMNLIKLERLWIEGSVNQLIFFLFYTKTLKMVIFNQSNHTAEPLDLHGWDNLYAILKEFDNRRGVLNLYELNEVRQMSGMKRKVRIGVKERSYLATKWSANSVNCLVEITRAERIRKHFVLKSSQM